MISPTIMFPTYAVHAEAISPSHMSAKYLAKAKAAMGKEDWRNFFHNVFVAAKLDPRNTEARLLAAQAFFALRRDNDALDCLEESIMLQRKNPDYAREYIRACLAKEQEARLIGIAKHVLATPGAGQTVREFFAKALAAAYFQRGEFERCAKVIESQKLGRTSEGFMLTVRMLWETGKRPEAIGMIEPVALAAGSEPSFISTLIDFKKESGDLDGARASVSLYLIGASEKYQTRIKFIELLGVPGEEARRDATITAYRRDFAGLEAPTLLLCEYAADNGLTPLCEELMREAKERKFVDAPRFELLHTESHMAAKRYEETVVGVDKIYASNPSWLPKYHLIFECLRMTSLYALHRDDEGKESLLRIFRDNRTLPMSLMSTVAKKLVRCGHPREAILVIDSAYAINGPTPANLSSAIDIHLEAGGSPDLPRLTEQLLQQKRPPTLLLKRLQDTLSGEHYSADSNRTKLLGDIAKLLSGKPIVPEIPETFPELKSIKRSFVEALSRRTGIPRSAFEFVSGNSPNL